VLSVLSPWRRGRLRAGPAFFLIIGKGLLPITAVELVWLVLVF
jgi:hypothetical protein